MKKEKIYPKESTFELLLAWFLIVTCMMGMIVFSPRAKADQHTYEINIFTASWCGPCRHLRTILERNHLSEGLSVDYYPPSASNNRNPSQTLRARIQINVFDIDIDAAIVQTKGFDSNEGVPAMSFIKNGRSLRYISGVVQTNTLQWLVNQIGQSFNFRNPHLAQSNRTRNNISPLIDARTNQPLTVLPGQSTAVMLIGTGTSPSENPYFTGVRLEQARQNLQNHFHIPSNNIIALYGDPTGPHQGRDTLLTNAGQESFITVPGVQASSHFNYSEFEKTIAAVSNARGREDRNILFYIAGHGSRHGLPAWGSPPISPDEWKRIVPPNLFRSTVMVSGACYGGQFADAVSCGFFAAHPAFLATGCYSDSLTMSNQSQQHDYLRYFQENLLLQRQNAPAPTFKQIHQETFNQTLPLEVPYSSYDHLIAKFLRSRSRYAALEIPDVLTFDQISLIAHSPQNRMSHVFEAEIIEKSINEPSVKKSLKDTHI